MKYIDKLFDICLIIYLFFGVQACAGTLEQRVESGLYYTAALVEPASKLTFDQCKSEKEALARAQDPVGFEVAAKRCQTALDVFDRIADIHAAAVTALENGNIRLAADLLEQVKTLSKGLIK